MTGEDYEARKDEHRPDWPGYHDPLLDGLPRYDSNGFPAADGAFLYASDLPALIARVREDERIRTLDYVQTGNTVMNVFGTYYGQGYAAGLSAAREAVVKLPRPLSKIEALAAIDKLKEKP